MSPFELIKNLPKMQEQMNAFQEKIGEITATGSAAAGMVEIEVNGKLEVLSVNISPEAMEDREMLQDLIMAAFTDGMIKVREEISREAASLTGGLNLQGMNIPGFSA